MKEVWKDIKGFEGFYQVSNLGRVKGLDRTIYYTQTNQYNKEGVLTKKHFNEKILKSINKNGRNHVCLMDNYFKVYRLVVSNFIRPLKPKEEVNHIDGNSLNDRLDNLEICTRIENQNHAYNTGLNTYFEKAIKVKVNGVIYNSLGEAERATRISKQVLRDRLNGKKPKNKKYDFVIKRV